MHVGFLVFSIAKSWHRGGQVRADIVACLTSPTPECICSEPTQGTKCFPESFKASFQRNDTGSQVFTHPEHDPYTCSISTLCRHGEGDWQCSRAVPEGCGGRARGPPGRARPESCCCPAACQHHPRLAHRLQAWTLSCAHYRLPCTH